MKRQHSRSPSRRQRWIHGIPRHLHRKPIRGGPGRLSTRYVRRNWRIRSCLLHSSAMGRPCGPWCASVARSLQRHRPNELAAAAPERRARSRPTWLEKPHSRMESGSLGSMKALARVGHLATFNGSAFPSCRGPNTLAAEERGGGRYPRTEAQSLTGNHDSASFVPTEPGTGVPPAWKEVAPACSPLSGKGPRQPRPG